MYTRNQIDEMFNRMGLGTEEERSKFREFAHSSTKPKTQGQYIFIKCDSQTSAESMEGEHAQLERDF
jgi:hypothetical protein